MKEVAGYDFRIRDYKLICGNRSMPIAYKCVPDELMDKMEYIYNIRLTPGYGFEFADRNEQNDFYEELKNVCKEEIDSRKERCYKECLSLFTDKLLKDGLKMPCFYIWINKEVHNHLINHNQLKIRDKDIDILEDFEIEWSKLIPAVQSAYEFDIALSKEDLMEFLKETLREELINKLANIPNEVCDAIKKKYWSYYEIWVISPSDIIGELPEGFEIKLDIGGKIIPIFINISGKEVPVQSAIYFSDETLMSLSLIIEKMDNSEHLKNFMQKKIREINEYKQGKCFYYTNRLRPILYETQSKLPTGVYDWYHDEWFMFIDEDKHQSNPYYSSSIKTYLGVDYGDDEIDVYMYSSDYRKSEYKFVIDKEKKDYAIFCIWTYFSSSLLNKRQQFMFHHMQDFGIKEISMFDRRSHKYRKKPCFKF